MHPMLGSRSVSRSEGAAARLGLKRTTLQSRLRKYDIAGCFSDQQGLPAESSAIAKPLGLPCTAEQVTYFMFQSSPNPARPTEAAVPAENRSPTRQILYLCTVSTEHRASLHSVPDRFISPAWA